MHRVLRTSLGVAWLGSRSMPCIKSEEQIESNSSLKNSMSEFRILERQKENEPLTLVDFAAMEADLCGPKLKFIFFGETHTDSVAQDLEILTYKKLTEQSSRNINNFGFFQPKRKRWALALEFLSRDKQDFVNQYLKSTEIPVSSLFLEYTDALRYGPITALAKERGSAIIAANASKRFVTYVSHYGPDVLNKIAQKGEDTDLLPPIPYPSKPLSAAYAQRLLTVWPDNQVNNQRRNNLIASQCLWDATMAHSVLRHQQNTGDAIFLVCGRFHIEYFLGIIDHIEHLLQTPFGQALSFERQEFRVIVAIPLPAEQFDQCENEHWNTMRHHPLLQSLADFILFTRQENQAFHAAEEEHTTK
uniref:Haem-binding uptake Tiki superfamily ChaN domain-containing protein n=1 Tax=Aureoumbra lagunensis TaxID=44058 RepID=A0A7S3K3G4_9STRA|mmetsp:Transcript_19034/g.28769  ORF Transcript_19034/g.28769 Transcript_19034/m.28769 type:complete len:360 (+) Transcript_19034:110-1189(+)